MPLVLAIALAAVAGASLAGCDAGRMQVGEPAPPITGTALDGSPVDLASLRGRPVIVNFWASSCVPCREEFPLFQERLDTLGPRDGLVMLGVLYKDWPELAQQFITDEGATWPSMADPDGRIADAYDVVAPPQTYFIDKDGILRGFQIGQVRPEDFDAQYAKIAP